MYAIFQNIHATKTRGCVKYKNTTFIQTSGRERPVWSEEHNGQNIVETTKITARTRPCKNNDNILFYK